MTDTHPSVQAVRLIHQNNTNTTIRRSPACGSEDTAMGNYTHIDPADLNTSHSSINPNVASVSTATGTSSTSSIRTKTTASTAGTAKQNPEGGLEGAAMDNYSHMDNPTARPLRRGPDIFLDANTGANDKPSKPAFLNNSTSSRAPQNDTGVKDITQTVIDANLGNGDAQVALGDMYLYGEDVNQDFKAAMNWYMKAAEQEHAQGQCNVGVLYRDGLGVEQSFNTAEEWFQKSAERGNSTALNNLGFMRQQGQGKITQNYYMAMFWYRESEKQGGTIAQCNIGNLYQNGLGVLKNHSQAMEWYLKAAEQREPCAYICIGLLYETGLGVPKDIPKAIEWYKKAIDLEGPEVKRHLDRLHRQGYSLETGKKRWLLCQLI
ncbi:hypothetical protein BGW39_000859 [Mortierella sp. 14UC]|nr:hypothetical protein BGW39_000859 [Mortierella sp. 14UC]